MPQKRPEPAAPPSPAEARPAQPELRSPPPAARRPEPEPPRPAPEPRRPAGPAPALPGQFSLREPYASSQDDFPSTPARLDGDAGNEDDYELLLEDAIEEGDAPGMRRDAAGDWLPKLIEEEP